MEQIACSGSDWDAKAADPFARVVAGGGRERQRDIGRIVAVAGASAQASLSDAGAALGIGTLVAIPGRYGRSLGLVHRLRREDGAGGPCRLAEIQMIGEIVTRPDGTLAFQRGVSALPVLDAPLERAPPDDLARVYARTDRPSVRIGTLAHAPAVPAFALTDALLGKHLAILGSTGSGKSCALTVILRAILAAHPHGHVVLLDPHDEYGGAFGDQALHLDPSNLRLPYWLLTFEEIAHVLVNASSSDRAYAESAILREAILEAKRLFAHSADRARDDAAMLDAITIDTPVPYRLSELVHLINEAMGAFNKAESTAPFQHLLARIEAVRNDRRFEFMFSSLSVRDTMRQLLARVLRIPTEGQPITIVDLSGVPGEVVDVVVSVLVRLMFEFAMWSERGLAPPLLLVCEEAHRYVPEDARAGFGPTKRAIDRIAKEGRKYGLGLCLVSQRPAELSTTSLSQCNTVIALRMSNEHDQTFVRRTLPESAAWLLEALPSLNTREAVVVGDGVGVPVHIRFDELPPEARPSSSGAHFAKSWTVDCDGGFIADTLERWRRQIRTHEP